MLCVFTCQCESLSLFSLLFQTATQILSSPVLNHALLFADKSSANFAEIFSAFNSTAEAFRLKVHHACTDDAFPGEWLHRVIRKGVCVCTQILFVLVDVGETRNGRIMEYFGVRDFEAPLIRMVNMTDHVTYHLPSDTLNEEVIKMFCQSYLEGKAKVSHILTLCGK